MTAISVIIPVLDEQQRIGKRLAELRAEHFEQVIVVDGGSRDDTVEQVRRFPECQLLETPRGRAQQLNAGARAATHQVLLFLHADVQLPTGARAQIAETMNRREVVAGAFRTWHIDDRAQDAARRPGNRFWLHLADGRSRYSGLPYGDQALFVRRAVFERVGGFPEQPLMEDLELSRRLRQAGKIEVLRSSVRVSGRRFLHKPLRYCLMTNTFPLLYGLGVSSERLARLYHHVR